MKRLMLDYDFASGREASEYIAENGEKHFHKAALLTSKGFIAFSPEGEDIRVNTAALPFEQPVCSLFDPVSGVKSFAGRLEKGAEVKIAFPDRRDGTRDWGIIIEEL